MALPAPVGSSSSNLRVIDPAYEFSAPQFYDFTVEERDEDVQKAELWFEENQPYAPSPFMLRIKSARAVQPQILSDLVENQHTSKEPDSIVCSSDSAGGSAPEPLSQVMPQPEVRATTRTNDQKLGTAKKIASPRGNPSSTNSKKQMQNLEAKSTKLTSARRDTGKKIAGTPNFAHENHAIERQKLEGEKSRQILTVNKTSNLPQKTMSRANLNSGTSRVASAESTKNHLWKPQVKAPTIPVLQTSIRARPTKIKSSDELEREELQNVQQFKARPLNRKIFESKGDMGVFRHTKKKLTVPREFNFAVDKRIRPTAAAVPDKFDMLSICSKTPLERKPLQRNTTPNPFHEERGKRAQSILQEVPIPVPVKMRKPLAEIHEFNLRVNHRAADRAKFDNKIKEKETVYKRYREEAESSRMMEEEKGFERVKKDTGSSCKTSAMR